MSNKTSTYSETNDASFVAALGRYFPESLVTGIFLALLALLVTMPYLDPVAQLEMFGTGFFQLFTTQMLLILFWVLSATVVESVRIGAILDRIANALPTSQAGVIYATAFISLSLGWINWAFGLIGGILIGQQLCKRARENGTPVHYPLVLTGSLLALVIMNQGLSSTGGLMMADTTGLANFMSDTAGSIKMSAFVLDPVNLVSSVVFIVTLPLILVLLAPNTESEIEPLDEQNEILTGSIAETLDHYSPAPREEWELADRLEQSQLISFGAVGIGLASVIWHFASGGSLTLQWLAFLLIALGLLVHKSPMAFRMKTENATKWANHLAVPFLFYAGVYALLSAANLYGPIGDFLAATELTHVGSYLIALGLGLLVPDPGSVWVIFGPSLVATDIEVIPSLVSVMYGAGISNLWLGFLFTGILMIRGFEWREFVRYATIITVYMSIVLVGLLFLF